MLGGIVQPGEEAVYVHLLHGQLVGIGWQLKKVDVIQVVNQYSNMLEVLQGSLPFLAGIRLVYIKGGSPGASIYPVATQEDIVFLLLTTQPDL